MDEFNKKQNDCMAGCSTDKGKKNEKSTHAGVKETHQGQKATGSAEGEKGKTDKSEENKKAW